MPKMISAFKGAKHRTCGRQQRCNSNRRVQAARAAAWSGLVWAAVFALTFTLVDADCLEQGSFLLSSQALPVPSASAAAGTSASGASQHGRSLRSVVDPQPTKTDRQKMLNTLARTMSSELPPFTINSVSLSVSFLPPNAAVTNFMELQPFNSTSCNPRLAAVAEQQADEDDDSDTDASSTDTRRAGRRSVSKLADSSAVSRQGGSMVCGTPLLLDTRVASIQAIWLDGRLLRAEEYSTKKQSALEIPDVPAKPFTLKIVSKMQPASSGRQAGLFERDGYYTVNFEPFGMHRLTPYIERPDILPLWTLRLEADEASLPVLLSNGRLVEQGKLPRGRHYVVWKDPRPHSSYQTTIVAGKLAVKADTYVSCLTGKSVQLKIYVPPKRIQSVDFAMYVLKAGLAWFEAAWGQPYRQDSYTMAGLPRVQGEATESSQMGVFNVNFLAATPTTRTDKDAEAALRLIGHELFHTWAGNYVTVKSWYDLVLKEGLTTYLEQAFAADMDIAEAAAMGVIKPQPPFKAAACAAPTNSTAAAGERSQAAAAGVLPLQQLLPHLRGVAACRGGKGSCGDGVRDLEAASFYWRRIADVAYLRRHQVPEDEGDMPHPLRLTNTSKVFSPYTNTIYRKGAEAVRMYRLMMGPAGFSKGLSSWFSSYYGQAATLNDFHKVMIAAAPGALPSNWLAWYDQPGTPWVSFEPKYDSTSKTLKLELEQGNAVVEDDGYPGVKYTPLAIPIKVGLLTGNGRNLPLQLKGSPAGSKVLASEALQTAQLLLNKKTATVTFSNVPQQPVLSVLRGFSAPIKAWVDPQSLEDLAVIAEHDRDVFARYNAVNRLVVRHTLYELYWAATEADIRPSDGEHLRRVLEAAGGVEGVPETVIEALRASLQQNQPGGTKGYMLSIPSIPEMEMNMEDPEPLLLWQIRRHVGKVLAKQLQQELQQVIQQESARIATLQAQGFTGPAMNARHAANNALRMLAFNWNTQLEQQVVKRYYTSKAMSDRITALHLLVNSAAQKTADAALSHFKKIYADEPASMLEWLRVQGSSDRPDNVKNVQRVLSTPGDLDLQDTDAVVALLDEGWTSSAVNFEAIDGSGYKFLFDALVQVDKVNPQAASMLLSNFADYQGMSKPRRKMVEAQLKRLNKLKPQLSPELQQTLEWM